MGCSLNFQDFNKQTPSHLFKKQWEQNQIDVDSIPIF